MLAARVAFATGTGAARGLLYAGSNDHAGLSEVCTCEEEPLFTPCPAQRSFPLYGAGLLATTALIRVTVIHLASLSTHSIASFLIGGLCRSGRCVEWGPTRGKGISDVRNSLDAGRC